MARPRNRYDSSGGAVERDDEWILGVGELLHPDSPPPDHHPSVGLGYVY